MAAARATSSHELGHTRFAKGTRTFLISTFVAIISAIPLVEVVSDYLTASAKRREMMAAHAPLAEIPGRKPQVFDILRFVPSPRSVVRARTLTDWKNLLPSARVLRVYTDGLSLDSRVGKVIRPWAHDSRLTAHRTTPAS